MSVALEPRTGMAGTTPHTGVVARLEAPTSAPPVPWLAAVSHTDPKYGGLSAAVPQLERSLAPEGFAVRLAAFTAPDEMYRPAGYPTAAVDFWPLARKDWLMDATLRSSFKAAVREAAGVHVHGLWEMSTLVACRTARRQGRPYVLSAHGMLEPWALQRGRWKKQVYAAALERTHVRQAACLHALTEAEATQYRRFGAKGPIAVVPNAVSVPAELTPEPFLQAFPQARARRLVLFLGRLHPKKGLQLLVPAWLRLWREFPDALLVLAGPDSLETRVALQGQVSAAGAEASVLFPGMLDPERKWSALAASEIFVLPSFSEGLSMGVLEALGAGVPVLLTRGCNMPEAAAAGAGWEIEPAVQPLEAVLRAALGRQPEANRAMGQRGAALIQARYSPERVARQMAAVYRFALTGTQDAELTLFGEGAR